VRASVIEQKLAYPPTRAGRYDALAALGNWCRV